MADTNYQSVQYVVTNIPETISDSAVKRNIQKCFNIQVCEFVRLPDSTAGLITFEDERGGCLDVYINYSALHLALRCFKGCADETVNPETTVKF